ncbi:macro domain-containing protein [Candidatus Margulisiibacteriota bacterium]
MIEKILIGDIFKSEAQTLVNTVNCVGVMGKGLALGFKKQFPDMFKDYEKNCKEGWVKMGRPYLFKHSLYRWILLFPTKDDWRSISKLTDIEEGLEYLEKNYKEWGIISLAVPPLGCGLGALDWRIVGPTLYRHLNKLDIPVELFAPHDTPAEELTPEFLANPGKSMFNGSKPKIEPGFVSIVEVLRRLEEIPYHWAVGRTMFQKICYFGTLLGLDTGLKFYRASYGPFSNELKSKMTKLINNGLVREEKTGNMFRIRAGKTFDDARKIYADEISKSEDTINKIVDLFCRLDTNKAEIAATVDFAYRTIKLKHPGKATEQDVYNEVMEWKKRRKPVYERNEVVQSIHNLAVHRWIDLSSERHFKECELAEI